MGLSGLGTFLVNSNMFAAPAPVLVAGVSGGSESFLGNTVYANSTNYCSAVLNLAGGSGTWNCNSNSYFCTPNNAVSFIDLGVYHYTLAMWRATNGFDLSSSTNNWSVPPDSVAVIPNQDQPKRCHIAVCNWSLKNNVTVNLSGVLSAGDSYSLYSAQNYRAGAIQTGIFNGATIIVPMTNLTSAPVLYGTNVNYSGETIVQPPPTSPEFGAFVVIGSSPALAPPTNIHVISLGL
jgi:hypothetical protein